MYNKFTERMYEGGNSLWVLMCYLTFYFEIVSGLILVQKITLMNYLINFPIMINIVPTAKSIRAFISIDVQSTLCSARLDFFFLAFSSVSPFLCLRVM